MLQYLRRRREDEQGFTLIELMVVVLIIAILIAIAIPTFLGAQNRARDRAAQSDLRNALSAAKTISTDRDGFFQTAATCSGNAVNAAALFAEESALTYSDTISSAALGVAARPVGVAVSGTCNEITLVRQSNRSSGSNVFCIAANQSGQTVRGVGTTYPTTYAACDALTDW